MRQHRTTWTAPLLLVAITLFSAAPALADWFPNNPADLAAAKWIQLPHLQPTTQFGQGMDVLATLQGPQSNVQPPNQPLWKILADDFECTQSGPITDVHIWGSWWNDQLPTFHGVTSANNVEFKLSFHSDVPAAIGAGGVIIPSHPGALLWQGFFLPGTYTSNNQWGTSTQELFYDPNLDTHTPTPSAPNGVIGGDNVVWQYNFKNLGPNPFVQQQGTVYWLDVQALVFEDPNAVTPPSLFGWKTRNPDPTLSIDPSRPGDFGNGGGHFNDDAVFGDTTSFGGLVIAGGGIAGTGWNELRYPFGHPLFDHSIDLAFVLTVPEPGTIALGGLGLVALVGMAYRRRRSAA